MLLCSIYSTRISLTQKQKFRDYISLSESWGINLILRSKLRDQNAYFVFSVRGRVVGNEAQKTDLDITICTAINRLHAWRQTIQLDIRFDTCRDQYVLEVEVCVLKATKRYTRSAATSFLYHYIQTASAGTSRNPIIGTQTCRASCMPAFQSCTYQSSSLEPVNHWWTH